MTTESTWATGAAVTAAAVVPGRATAGSQHLRGEHPVRGQRHDARHGLRQDAGGSATGLPAADRSRPARVAPTYGNHLPGVSTPARPKAPTR